MNKTIQRLICGLALYSAMIPRAYAVWPPSTVMTEEEAPPPSANTEGLTAISQKAHDLVEKLEVDERRLQVVLRDLEEDKKKLKEQDHGHSVR